MKIVYCTPSLYIAGGVERVLTSKMNWLVEHTDMEVYVVLTDGVGKDPYYPLDPRVKVIQLGIDFEELWHLSFLKKGLVYLKKQRRYKKELERVLMQLRPDITDTLMRREVNFLSKIKDGSHKVGELHVNRKNYRNFEANETNWLKRIFEKLWMRQLLNKIKKLDRFVVLSDEDARNWQELSNVEVIPNPLPQLYSQRSTLENKKVVACGRYVYQKGFDILIEAWKKVSSMHPDWQLNIYGKGEREPYQRLVDESGLNATLHLCEATTDIESKYAESSIFVLSSRFEGFGMVLIEAMNCGVPCVSFACPCGPSDIITDGVDGLLAENGDAEQLAEKICWMIEHEDERKVMGQKAYDASFRYTIDSTMERWKALFERL